MTNQLQEKKQNELATQFENSNLASQELDTGDFTIPRILLMQGTSELLSSGDFQLGDIIHSADERKLAGKGETVEIIPFYIQKTYETFKKDGGDWVKSSPWGKGAPDLDWEGTHTDELGNTFEVKNVKNYNTYVLIAGEEDAFPCIISFRSSAGKEARKITSHFVLAGHAKRAPFNTVWSLGSEMITAETVNGKKAFQKYTLKKSRTASAEEMAAASTWLEAVAMNASKFTAPPEQETEDSVVTKTKATKEIKNHAPNATPKTAPKPPTVDAGEEMPF